jgi:hypothetical protein
MDIDVAEKEALTQLSRIEENLEEIKERTPSPKHAFINGIWQGAGVVLGTIVAWLGAFCLWRHTRVWRHCRKYKRRNDHLAWPLNMRTS